MTDPSPLFSFSMIIYGNSPRKSNSRIITADHRSIKSTKAQEFEKSFIEQVKTRYPKYRQNISLPCFLKADIFYSNRASDLSDELIADCLERSGVVINDNVFRRKHLEWVYAEDDNPRVELTIEHLPSYPISWLPKFSLEKKACQKIRHPHPKQTRTSSRSPRMSKEQLWLLTQKQQQKKRRQQ